MEHTWNDRSISIFTSEESSLIGTTSQKLIDRILDAEDSLSTHVNDLTIKDWKPEKGGTDAYKILNNLKDRESFRRLELDIPYCKRRPRLVPLEILGGSPFVSNTSRGVVGEENPI
ncbi:uncharacterized protein RAG0_15663 [Rhynchosporium agropyri]|uniref:Uncharacterized protein n=1 Tax=Rhynchosporium agropyri TaxID=914238 RepID=A0A1E1LM59_9HELO|nr:uncharacterized protein RAG0_15663 [Rhynchosporium agropyri]